MQICRRYAPVVEKFSIDECFLDMTGTGSIYPDPTAVAGAIKDAIREELGFTVNVGIGPNKILAKMASDMRKPMGITILRKQEVPKKLWPLPISDMWGIGKKTVPLLIKHGITTIGDLADAENESKIMTLLGKHAYTYIQNARGNGSAQLSFNTSVQSISQSTTLDRDITDYEEVKTVLKRLAATLSRRAREDHIKGSLISISIRYFDFTNAVRSTNIHSYTDDANVLLEHALLLFDRHLGIGLGSLYSAEHTIDQIDLFQHEIQPLNDVEDVLKELNAQLPGAHLIRASDIHASKGQK